MATLGNMLIMTFVLVFTLYLGYGTDYSVYGFQSNIGNVTVRQMSEINNATSQLTSSVTSQASLPFLGTITFPNPFGIFLGTYQLLSSLLNAPVVVITALDLPSKILTGLQGLLILTLAYLAVTWYKGQTT